MPSSASTILRLEKPANGEKSGLWGTISNLNYDMIEAGIGGTTSVSTTGGTTTLTNVDYVNDQAKKRVLYVSGTLVSNAIIVVPNASKTYVVINATAGAFTVTIKTATGVAIAITQGAACEVYCDGANVMLYVSPMVVIATGAPLSASGAAASAVSVAATGNLGSTNAQAALVELQGDIDTINTALGTKQALDSDLTTIAGLSQAKGNGIFGDGSAWSAVTVGSNGLVLTANSSTSAGVEWATVVVPDNAVTYAKLQDVSATSRALGRKTAGAGDTEELTLSELLDFIGSATKGDILVRDTSAWTRLAAGTSTHVLTANGAGALPTYQAPNLVRLTSGTVSAAATLDLVLTAYTAYRGVVFELINFVPATDDVELWMRLSTDGGTTYDAGAGHYRWATVGSHDAAAAFAGGSASDTKILIAGHANATWGASNVAAEGGATVSVTIMNQTSGAIWPQLSTAAHWLGATPTLYHTTGSGMRVAPQDTDAVRFLFEAGNIASGSYVVYGMT